MHVDNDIPFWDRFLDNKPFVLLIIILGTRKVSIYYIEILSERLIFSSLHNFEKCVKQKNWLRNIRRISRIIALLTNPIVLFKEKIE